MMEIPSWFFYVILFVLGSVLGSFFNVCIYRLPREESVAWPGSHCPHCRHPLSVRDNLPLVSFLLLKGSCRYCQAPISFQYPLVEGITGLAAVLMGWKFGLSWALLQAFLFFSALLVVSVIDLYHRIIPDLVTFPGIGLGVLLAWLSASPGIGSSLIGLVLGGGVLWLLAFGYALLTGKEGMGGGDIKLLAMIGAFLGWPGVLVTLLSGSFLGTLVGLGLMLFWKKGRTYAVPFGPFLSAGALIHLFWGPALIRWYLG
ncbi:MAG: A24 family peptidase [Thermodesulfobacteriota bacterium]